MNPETVMTIGTRALEVTLMLAAPMLIVALVVGLAVGVFQAATQINEQTLSFIPKLLAMGNDAIADLPGVSGNRAHQVVAGALVASAVMDIFDLDELEICPWALREGVILERLDQISVLGVAQ